MQGNQVTQRYLAKQGFHCPIMVTKSDGLGLQLPPPSFSVKDVEQYVGGDKVIDVIDVARQADSKMKLGDFVKYYCSPHRPKVLNVISLEFSDTKMAELVVVPDVAKMMSWVENYWPDDSFFPKPFVQKYCLMGMKDSYTDFHIDFGGTSVWYHVLWGEKVFFLIKPTDANLALYEAWSSSPNQSEVFFGEKVDKCYKCVVKQGTTLLVPTGWIHAVLTSQDCMAFGGNFLHNLNIGMQLRCYDMERRLRTPDLFKFPYFEAICWYVASNLLETLKELREDDRQPPAYLMEGIKALTAALKNWLRREGTEPASEVPDHIRPNHLIKELTKEIRYQEEDQVGGGCRLTKPQGSWTSCVTRATLERGSAVHRAARRLRDHHVPKSPSNLDVLELHTREVLRRLEMEGGPLVSGTNGKFNKVSTVSVALAERNLNNNLRLVLCNGRIFRDERQHDGGRSENAPRDEALEGRCGNGVEVERTESGQGRRGYYEGVRSELRNGTSGHSGVSDSESELKDASEECSGTSGEEEEEKGESSRNQTRGVSGEQVDRDNPPKIEGPTSPSTAEAIEGMPSMAGLLNPQTQENSSSLLESRWSSPVHRSPDDGESASGEESQGNSDSDSSLCHQGERQVPAKVRMECEGRTQLSRRIQENQNFMDSLSSSSSSSSSSDSWVQHRLSPYPSSPPHQCRETSLSPPLHPSKRPTSNPPPVSNQATKGKRPKKGMATAKQRLGKILRLNPHGRCFV